MVATQAYPSLGLHHITYWSDLTQSGGERPFRTHHDQPQACVTLMSGEILKHCDEQRLFVCSPSEAPLLIFRKILRAHMPWILPDCWGNDLQLPNQLQSLMQRAFASIKLSQHCIIRDQILLSKPLYMLGSKCNRAYSGSPCISHAPEPQIHAFLAQTCNLEVPM